MKLKKLWWIALKFQRQRRDIFLSPFPHTENIMGQYKGTQHRPFKILAPVYSDLKAGWCVWLFSQLSFHPNVSQVLKKFAKFGKRKCQTSGFHQQFAREYSEEAATSFITCVYMFYIRLHLPFLPHLLEPYNSFSTSNLKNFFPIFLRWYFLLNFRRFNSWFTYAPIQNPH